MRCKVCGRSIEYDDLSTILHDDAFTASGGLRHTWCEPAPPQKARQLGAMTTNITWALNAISNDGVNWFVATTDEDDQ